MQEISIDQLIQVIGEQTVEIKYLRLEIIRMKQEEKNKQEENK